MIAEHLLEAEHYTARRAAHAAGQIDHERVLCIHRDAGFFQLLLQTERGDGIAEEQGLGVFIVHKVTLGVGFSQLSSLLHGFGIVAVVFDHGDALGAQQVLLPLAGVSGHVYCHLKAEFRTHDADGQAQIAGGAYSDGPAAEKPAERFGIQHAVIILRTQHAAGKGDVLSRFEHFIHTAARLDGAGHGQVVVHF